MQPRPPFFEFQEHLAIDLPGARALFTTRRGGLSSGPYQGLNLGINTADDAEPVRGNHRAVEQLIGRPATICRQVHGTAVRRVDGERAAGFAGTASAPGAQLLPDAAVLPEADGQLTTTAELAPMVLVADCLPIVLAAPGAVAVLHGGWRGLAGGIVAAGVRALRKAGVTGAIEAAIGPGAGRCCYEVGEEVHGAFSSHGPAVREGRRIDLKATARSQLLTAGVVAVHDLELCTICSDPSVFYSYRRDGGVTGRQAGVAWLV